jgi:uroporphyrinogen-III decarboxylase
MRRKEPKMDKVLGKIKQAWEENPLAVIAVASTAVMAASKLMDANTARRNQKVWQMEVMRRSMMRKN